MHKVEPTFAKEVLPNSQAVLWSNPSVDAHGLPLLTKCSILATQPVVMATEKRGQGLLAWTCSAAFSAPPTLNGPH